MPSATRGSGPRRLTALVVGDGPGAFALRCAESLRREWEREGGAADALELLVCDAREDPAEASWGRSLEHLGGRVLPAAAMAGDAERVARGLAASDADDDTPALLLSPDLYLLPGGLGPLLAALDEPRAGLVVPRRFLDETVQIELPPAERPPLRERALERLARAAPALQPLHDAARLTRLSRRWSEEPLVPLARVPGGCLLAGRGALEQAALAAGAGGLDALEAALERQLRREGRALLEAREARVVHHGSRWSGLRRAVPPRRWLDRLCLSVGAAPRELRRAGGFDLGELAEPPTFVLPRLAHFWIELAPEPAPRQAAGVLGAGASYALPFRAWSWLPPGRYLARAIDRQSGAALGRWRFAKAAPARGWPLDAASVAHLEPRPPRGAGRRAGG